jgi:histidine triad (HIT) family protein
MHRISKALFSLAQTQLATRIIGWVFAHLSWGLPIKRLYETDHLLVFHHPFPTYKIHILIVPKKAIPSVLELTPADNLLLADILQTTSLLINDLNPRDNNFRLVVNGGGYQNIPQLHFHLIADGQE